jgi:hypothetical protein
MTVKIVKKRKYRKANYKYSMSSHMVILSSKVMSSGLVECLDLTFECYLSQK